MITFLQAAEVAATEEARMGLWELFTKGGWLMWPLLILGGGVGNIIDRIANGYVVDMFDLLLFDYPVFNLADCFVVVGVILGAVYYLWFYEKYDARKKDDATDADGDK